MNRTLIITSGVIILVLVLVVWLYLMLFGAPESREEVFTNLGFSITPQATTVTPPPPSTPIENLVDTNTGSLRQLTTRPVAGFVGFTTSANASVVRYAEQGTGYVYEIDLATGSETIVSRTTVPQVAEAAFSSDGTHLTLTSYDGYTKSTKAGSITDGSLKAIELEPGADNFFWETPGVLKYSVVTNGATVGYSHNIASGARTEEFRFAFTSTNVAWTEDATYVTPRAGLGVAGTVYKINGSTVTPASEPGFFLTALPTNDGILYGRAVSNGYETKYTSGTSSATLPLLALPEKCVSGNSSVGLFWCAAPLTTPDTTTIDQWYKGATTFADSIWLLSADTVTARLVANPERLIERSLDITNLALHANGTSLLFVNRPDQTLWLYDLLTQ